MAQEHHSLLERHLTAGSLDRAESVARHLLSLDPEDLMAQVALARVKAARGELEAALWQLKSLVADNPRRPEPVAYLAVVMAHRGEPEQALSLARRSLALGGDVAAALCLVADHELHRGAHEDALPLYERALQASPAHADAWLGKGRILAFRGQLGQAEDAYVNAVEHGPERVDAWVELIALEREGGADDVAADNLALALRTHPGHPDLLALARAQQPLDGEDTVGQAVERIRDLLLGEEHESARVELDRLIESHPSDERVVLAKAYVTATTAKGEVPALVHALMRLTRAEPNAWQPKVALGRLLLLQSPVQNPRLAAAHCEDAWRTSGEHPFAGLALVDAWAACGKRPHARALCLKLAQGSGLEARVARGALTTL